MAKWPLWLAEAANKLFEHKNFNQAWGLAELALAMDPNHHLGHILAGICLRADNDLTQSEAAFRRALEIKPGDSMAMANLGAVIYDIHPAEGLEMLRRALDEDPGSDFITQVYMNALLSSGEFERGWNLHNRRMRFPAVGNQICKYPTPIWDGLRKDTVLLVGEEGIGERIMFASMVRDVINAGAKPMIEMTSGFERFAPWFARSFPGLKIVKGGELHKFDSHITIGDLGHMYRRKLRDFPKHKGYMTWDKKRAAHFRHRLSPGPVIGIAYKSSSMAGPHKSIPLQDLGPILRIRGASFVDLQYGGTEQERNAHAPLMNHLPDLDLVNDMDGLAALIGACDLVITVSSVTAHMAGAMGKPVWTFIPARNGRMWFWGVEGNESPWYPSMELFRQDMTAGWKPTIERVAKELTDFVDGNKNA